MRAPALPGVQVAGAYGVGSARAGPRPSVAVDPSSQGQPLRQVRAVEQIGPRRPESESLVYTSE